MREPRRPWYVRRLFRFPQRSRADVRADVAEEFAFHLDMRTEDLMREGLSADMAREQALCEFGDRSAGLRACGAAVAILTLALGPGATTAIYTVLDARLLQPLPYPHPERLAHISETQDTGRPNSVTGGAFLDWQAHQTQFKAIALTGRISRNLRGATSTERLRGLEVSSDFFRVLGRAPRT